MSGKSTWRLYLALIVAGILVVVLLNVTGVPEEGREKLAQQQQEQPLPSPGALFSRMPAGQTALLTLAGVVWIGGIYALAIRQARKAGRSWSSCLNPFRPVFRDFDRRAWTILAVLLVIGLLLVSASLSYPPPE